MLYIKSMFIKLYRAYLKHQLANGVYGYNLFTSDILRITDKIEKLDDIVYGYNKKKEN